MPFALPLIGARFPMTNRFLVKEFSIAKVPPSPIHVSIALSRDRRAVIIFMHVFSTPSIQSLSSQTHCFTEIDIQIEGRINR